MIEPKLLELLLSPYEPNRKIGLELVDYDDKDVVEFFYQINYLYKLFYNKKTDDYLKLLDFAQSVSYDFYNLGSITIPEVIKYFPRLKEVYFAYTKVSNKEQVLVWLEGKEIHFE